MAMSDRSRDAWLARNRAALARAELAPQIEQIGRVEAVADGIARISGLPSARLGELLRFEGGQSGFVLALDAAQISAVLIDDDARIEVRLSDDDNTIRVRID